MLSAYELLSKHSQGAKRVVAGLTDSMSASTYKMSGTTYPGWDFSRLYSKYNLSTPPSSYEAAAVASVLLNPRPDALNLSISPIYATNELYAAPSPVKPGIGSAWLTDFSNTRLPDLDRERFHQSNFSHTSLKDFCLFTNYGDSKNASCATRVLQLLGCAYPLVDSHHLALAKQALRLGDPNKLGMEQPALANYLIAAWSPHSMVFDDSNAIEGVNEEVYAQLHATFPLAPILVCLHDGHVTYAIRRDFLYVELTNYRSAYQNASPYLSGRDKELLTTSYPKNSGRAGGRVHLTLEMLLKTSLEPAQRAILLGFLKHRNAGNDFEQVFITTVALLPFLEGPAGRDLTLFFLRNMPVICTLTTDQVAKWLKAAHAHARIFQSLPGLALPAITIQEIRMYGDLIYGLDSLVGRSELMKLDFTAELFMRTADPIRRAVPTLTRATSGFELTLSEELYETYEDRAINTTFREVLPDKLNLESFEAWYARRMFWGASGGAPGAKITWSDREGGDKLRLNKRGALLAIPAMHFTKILERAISPVLWSVKALKFEPGKLRSILNTSMEHYVMQAYLLDHFDANVNSGTWYAIANAGAARLAAHARRLESLRHSVGFMWDFADFNINHTFVGMEKLFSALSRELLTRAQYANNPAATQKAARDIKQITSWVNAARHKTYLSDNDTQAILEIKRSLQSGERATMWVNTLRNNVDHRIVSLASEQLFGYDLAPDAGDKTGDDVFLTTRTVGDAVLMSALYNLCGAAGQAHKILLSYPQHGGARGEFVRYAYDASANRVSGYPLRALAGVVHGEFFTEPVTNPADRGATLIQQFAKVARRGVALPDALLDIMLDASVSLAYTDSKGKHRVTVPRQLIALPAALGGVGVTETANGILHSETPSVLRQVNGSYAVCIPSGEGKTTLARRYPSLFVDHDDYADLHIKKLLTEAKETGQYDKLNSAWRDAPVPKHKVLLTWHPNTVPHGTEILAACMLSKGIGLRANAANRAALRQAVANNLLSKEKLKTFNTMGALLAYVTQTAIERIDVVRSRTFAMVSNDDHSKIGSLPMLNITPVGASSILRAAHTHVVDYDSLRRFGVSDKTQVVDTALLKSALTAAYPSTVISNALATLGKDLHEYLRSHKIRPIRVAPLKISTVNVLQQLKLAYSRTIVHLHTSGGGFVPAPRHSYNSLVGLMRPAGFSNGAALALAISAPKPSKAPGKLGKLFSFLDIATAHGKTADASTSAALLKYSQEVHAFYALSSKSEGAADSLFQYLSGNVSFFPPSGGFPAEMLALARDLTLQHIETAHPTLLSGPAEHLRTACAAIESLAILAIVSTLQERLPGFIIRD
uniref:RNA-directed RNA polymerase n=1 Tax=Botrytis cinerea RNA virus 1 TaxID=1568973 RepID=A0A7L9R691_9VIRU|nr:RNA-dependent RNA polymerase [Botrytis cinerea RNA virus 1]